MSIFEAVAEPAAPEPGPQAGAAVSTSAVAEPDRRLVRVSAFLFGIVLAVVVVLGGAWFATGGRFFIMTTPSMSPVLPVGSLVLTRPFDASKVKVGTIIAFVEPVAPYHVYTHRVVGVTPLGYRTRGDVEIDADRWVVPQANVKGIAVQAVPGLGYLVRSLPWLIVGLLFALALAAWTPWRWAVFMPLIAAVVVVVVPILRFRPLVNAMYAFRYGVAPDEKARVVNTGLLPLAFHITGQTGSTYVPAGHWTDLPIPTLPHKFAAHITAHVSLGIVGWCILGLVCASPLLVGIAVTWREWHVERRELASSVA